MVNRITPRRSAVPRTQWVSDVDQLAYCEFFIDPDTGRQAKSETNLILRVEEPEPNVLKLTCILYEVMDGIRNETHRGEVSNDTHRLQWAKQWATRCLRLRVRQKQMVALTSPDNDDDEVVDPRDYRVPRTDEELIELGRKLTKTQVEMLWHVMHTILRDQTSIYALTLLGQVIPEYEMMRKGMNEENKDIQLRCRSKRAVLKGLERHKLVHVAPVGALFLHNPYRQLAHRHQVSLTPDGAWMVDMWYLVYPPPPAMDVESVRRREQEEFFANLEKEQNSTK